MLVEKVIHIIDIYDFYDDLKDYTIFLQGNPFDHSPNIISDLNNYINNNLDIDFKFLSRDIIECNLSGCKHHSGIPLIETYEKLFNEKKNRFTIYIWCSIYSI